MSLIQPCIFVDVSRSNLAAKAEAAMLELKRDGGMLCFTLVLFLRARNSIGQSLALHVALECFPWNAVVCLNCSRLCVEETGSEPAARERAADCSYCLSNTTCGTHRKTAAQEDWCSENNRNRNIEGVCKGVIS